MDIWSAPRSRDLQPGKPSHAHRRNPPHPFIHANPAIVTAHLSAFGNESMRSLTARCVFSGDTSFTPNESSSIV